MNGFECVTYFPFSFYSLTLSRLKEVITIQYPKKEINTMLIIIILVQNTQC